MLKRSLPAAIVVLAPVLVLAAGCNRNRPPAVSPAPPPPMSTPTADTAPPSAPSAPAEPRPVPPEPVKDDPILTASLDELNRNSPLRPVFFAYDSAEITGEGRAVLDANVVIFKRYPMWTVTIEGHCDERGTAEYNLALGERRAVAARTYLVSLGVPADRLRIVSYGKEFPFDPGKDEGAWAKNRRAHFVITGR
jgi:peptidoglycan-associated lipoprotein